MPRITCCLLVPLFALFACQTSGTPPTQTPTTKPNPKPATKQARVEKRIAKYRAAAAKETERWTPQLKAQANALLAKSPQTTAEAMPAILASSHRVPGNSARDGYRHPAETLAFFGITPKSAVVEFGAGAGWYTELLAPLLAKQGKLTVISPDPNGPATEMSKAYGTRIALFLKKSTALFGAVQHLPINPAKVVLGPPGTADVVVAIREMHNWVRRDKLAAYVAAAHAVLKAGGTFGVVQHRAPANADPAKSAKKGYLPQAWLIKTVEAAGFKLKAASEVNANPKDTKDYAKGVWTLPPSFTLGQTDREKYQAIGESDRMTLRFIKQ